MLLILALLLLMAGVALCVVGEVKLWSGRVLSPWAARAVAAALCAFLPLTLAARALIDNPEAFHITLINWALLVLCLVTALVLVLRLTTPVARPVQRTTAAPVANPELPVVDFEPAPPSRPAAPKGERSPFDFS